MTEEQAEWAHDLIALYHDQLSFGSEIIELSAQFFNDDIEYDEESPAVFSGEQVPEVMASFKEKLKHLKHLMHRRLKPRLKLSKKKRGIKAKTYLCRFVS